MLSIGAKEVWFHANRRSVHTGPQTRYTYAIFYSNMDDVAAVKSGFTELKSSGPNCDINKTLLAI